MVSIDWRVQAFSAIVAILTACIASAVPAIRALRGRTSAIVAAGSTQDDVRLHGAREPGPGLDRSRACVALLMAGGVVIKGLRDLSEPRSRLRINRRC